MKKISAIKYLVHSEEFKCFSRPLGDVEKMLAALPPISPHTLKDRFENGVGIDPNIIESEYKE